MYSIEKTYTLLHPPAVVYAAWVSSEYVVAPAHSLNIDPVIGGIYQLNISPEVQNVGRFIEVVPNQRLKYSWEWNHDGEVSEITVTFQDDPSGTNVYIHHTGFLTTQSRDNHDTGWDSYINGLELLLNR